MRAVEFGLKRNLWPTTVYHVDELLNKSARRNRAPTSAYDKRLKQFASFPIVDCTSLVCPAHCVCACVCSIYVDAEMFTGLKERSQVK